MWVGQVGGVDVNLSTQIPSALWGRCLHVAYQEARSGFARTACSSAWNRATES